MTIKTPPVAPRIPHSLEAHDQKRVDDYYWMKNRDDEKVLAHLRAENAYTHATLKSTEWLQKDLYEEMKGRFKQDDSSVPSKHDDYYYYQRFESGKEYPVFCRKRANSPEEIILDVNELARGHSYFNVAAVKPSADHRLLAYAVDAVGRRIYTLHFKDLTTGKSLKDTVPEITASLAWANDNRTIYYAKQDPRTLRSDRIFKHVLGSDAATDPLVYEERDPTFSVYVHKTKTKRFLIIASESTLSSESRYLNADQPEGAFQVFLPREANHEYDIDDGGDRFYVRTNFKAKNFRLMETRHFATDKKHWKEVVPHRADTLLEQFEVFKNHVALQERNSGLTRIRVLDRRGGQASSQLSFPDPAYLASLGDNPQFDTPWLRFDYESLTTPDSVYDYHMGTGERILQKQREVLGGFQRENYESLRLFATAPDGTRIPISMVYRKGRPRGPKTPVLLYGYGAYGLSAEPYFNSNLLSLMDRGFVFAIAHVRGGSEMGRSWYDDGRLLNKRNSFSDFIACAEHLIQEGYTSDPHLYAMGGSAGGLLMGAVMNMRPELFHGIIAAVPFVDVLTTMLDPEIPLTTSEYDEWGNPSDRKYHDYIRSYSPYDNISERKYPHLLVTSGLHDSQVQYWEPTKWVARLRTMNSGPNLILLKTDMEAGHGGKSGRFERLKETALEYAFLLFLENRLEDNDVAPAK